MSKLVLMSIQPYYVFLIIAHKMGWNIPQEKTVEVRKTRPTDENWDKKAIIYCSRNKKSFNQIPKEYQSLIKPFLGNVIGEFVCDEISEYDIVFRSGDKGYWGLYHQSCLSLNELDDYGQGKTLYGWHISDLVIYDEPKELSECSSASSVFTFDDDGKLKLTGLTRPPQSWCYVEGTR